MTFIPAAARAAGAKLAKGLGKKAGRAAAAAAVKKKRNGGSCLTIVAAAATVLVITTTLGPLGFTTLAMGMLGDSVDLPNPDGPSSQNAIPTCAVIRPVDEIDAKTPNATWDREQLDNLYMMIDVARTLDWENMTIPSGDFWAQGEGASVPVSALHIAIGTAMQESSLRNLMYDDDAENPDGSTADGGGLFQQQPSQGWGTWEQVTNPRYATSRFLYALREAKGWEKMEPWQAAHTVQINDRASDYKKWLAADGDAQVLLDRFIDTSKCSTVPVDLPYRISSGYGPRSISIPGASKWHPAWDFGVACGKPIYAVRAGKVTEIGWGAANGLGIKDPESGATLRYLHQQPGTELVAVGDTVEVGQQIGVVGEYGVGGCHLDLRIFAPKSADGTALTDTLQHSEDISGAAPRGYVHPDEFMGLFGSTLCPEGCTKGPGIK